MSKEWNWKKVKFKSLSMILFIKLKSSTPKALKLEIPWITHPTSGMEQLRTLKHLLK